MHVFTFQTCVCLFEDLSSSVDPTSIQVCRSGLHDLRVETCHCSAAMDTQQPASWIYAAVKACKPQKCLDNRMYGFHDWATVFMCNLDKCLEQRTSRIAFV